MQLNTLFTGKKVDSKVLVTNGKRKRKMHRARGNIEIKIAVGLSSPLFLAQNLLLDHCNGLLTGFHASKSCPSLTILCDAEWSLCNVNMIMLYPCFKCFNDYPFFYKMKAKLVTMAFKSHPTHAFLTSLISHHFPALQPPSLSHPQVPVMLNWSFSVTILPPALDPFHILSI